MCASLRKISSYFRHGEKTDRFTAKINHRDRTMQLLVMAATSFILLLTGSQLSQAVQIPLSEYHLRIQSSIERAEENEGKIQAEESSRFQQMFPPDLVVQDSTGDFYPVDMQDFFRWLEKAEETAQGRDRFLSHQRALFQQISWDNSGFFRGQGSWGECRTLLDNLYRGPEFRNLVKKETPPWKRHLHRFLEGLGRWLEDHLQVLGGTEGKWIFYLAYGGMLMLGGILIIWIIRSFGLVAWRWKRPQSIHPPALESLPEKGWWAWREEAHKKAEQGAFREAIRFLFISVLVEGHQKGWWIYKPEATNREHLARMEGHSQRRAPLQKLMQRYELAWYGLQQPGKEDFLACEKWTQRMETPL
jgi:hypothetical protein